VPPMHNAGDLGIELNDVAANYAAKFGQGQLI
jgi:hypothetical protein